MADPARALSLCPRVRKGLWTGVCPALCMLMLLSGASALPGAPLQGAEEQSAAASGVKPDHQTDEGIWAHTLARNEMLERVQSRLTLAAYRYAAGTSIRSSPADRIGLDVGCRQFVLWPLLEDGSGWPVHQIGEAVPALPYVEFQAAAASAQLRVVTAQGEDSVAATDNDSRVQSNDPGLEKSMENRERILRLLKQVLLPLGAYHVLFQEYPEAPAEAYNVLKIGLLSTSTEALLAEVDRIQFMRSASGDKIGLVAYPKSNNQPILALHEDPDFTLITPFGAQFLHDVAETDRHLASLEVWDVLDLTHFPILTQSPCAL